MSDTQKIELIAVQALLEQGRFDDACHSMRRTVNRDGQNHELWFMYACCLNESGRHSEAIDAALRSWLISKEEFGNARVMATQIMRDLRPAAPEIDVRDAMDAAVTRLREELEEKLAPGGDAE